MPSDPTGLAATAAALAQPFTTLVETLENAGATIYEPTRIRRRAAAEHEAHLLGADAERQVKLIRAETDAEVLELASRAQDRILAREVRRERNLQAIAEGARAQLQQLPADVSGDPVDPDWTAALLDCCQDVSNQEMQSLWSKILAGEVAKPGSFSRRTLGFVRTLAAEDADAITRFGSLVWWLRSGDGPEEAYKLADLDGLRPTLVDEYESRHLLEELGICTGLAALGSPDPWCLDEGVRGHARYFSHRYVIEAPDGARIDVLKLSRVGRELLPIAGCAPLDTVRVAGLTLFEREHFVVRPAWTETGQAPSLKT